MNGYVHLPGNEPKPKEPLKEAEGYTTTDLAYCNKCGHDTVHTLTHNAEGSVIKIDCHKCWE